MNWKQILSLLVCTALLLASSACTSSEARPTVSEGERASVAAERDPPAAEQEEPRWQPIDVTPTFADVEFALVTTDSGEVKSLKMDIYSPDHNEGGSPVLIYVHGGAWLIGDYKNSDEMNGLASNAALHAWFSLRDQGVTIVNTGYRLSSESIFPAQIHDIKGAIRYLRANADLYGIDPDRIAIAGVSAGAQLAILAAVTGDVDELEGEVGGNPDYSSRVMACVDLFGMTDFTTLAADLYDTPWNLSGAETYELVDAPQSSRSRLFGVDGEGEGLGVVLADLDKTDSEYRDKIELIRSASAINYVSSDDPPIFIANGGQDPRVPVAQAIRMHEALTRAGVKSYLMINSEAGHEDLGDMVNSAMIRFLLEEFDLVE